MPHESATAALNTVDFPCGPFHDSFHAAVPAEDACGSWRAASHPWNVTPWTYRVIVSEYTLHEVSRPWLRYEVTVTLPRPAGVEAPLPPGGSRVADR